MIDVAGISFCDGFDCRRQHALLLKMTASAASGPVVEERQKARRTAACSSSRRLFTPAPWHVAAGLTAIAKTLQAFSHGGVVGDRRPAVAQRSKTVVGRAERAPMP